MKKIQSNQKSVAFIFCESPIIIDKRASWGENDNNLQKGPKGAFLKLNPENEVSHLVQPNKDRSAPVGWIPTNVTGRFDKAPIYVGNTIFTKGEVLKLETLDGKVTYEVKEDTMLCYNELNKKPNMKDVWPQTIAEIKKNYILD